MKRLASLFLAALFAFAPVAQADLRASSGAFGPATITSGTSKWDAGSAAAPSVAESTGVTGFYWFNAQTLGLTLNGLGRLLVNSTDLRLGSGYNLSWTNATDASNTVDTSLVRDGSPGILALKNANAAMEYRVYAGNGGFISNVKTATESLTIAAAATTVGVTSIPAGAILIGVSVRVTTIIPTAATFTITTTVGGTTLNTAAVSTAANSTDPGTAAGASFRSAATTVTITPNLQPAAATGVVRLQYYYLQITPPTS